MSAISMADYAAQVQDRMRKGLIQKITNQSIFLRILRFIPIPGFTYEYGSQETLGGIAFRTLNGSYTADAGVVNPKKEHAAR